MHILSELIQISHICARENHFTAINIKKDQAYSNHRFSCEHLWPQCLLTADLWLAPSHFKCISMYMHINLLSMHICINLLGILKCVARRSLWSRNAELLGQFQTAMIQFGNLIFNNRPEKSWLCYCLYFCSTVYMHVHILIMKYKSSTNGQIYAYYEIACLTSLPL